MRWKERKKETEQSLKCKAKKKKTRKGEKIKKDVIDRRARPHFVNGVKLGGQADGLRCYRQASSW